MSCIKLFCVVFSILGMTTPLLAQPVIYLVRHAEKLASWHGEELDDFHPLNEAGIMRANKLAGQFEKGSLAAIFSSSTTRTLHTVLPLAQKLGLTVQISPACWDTTAIDSFYAEIKKNYRPGQAILLVSHSNIIPYLLMRAGLPAACRREMRFANAPDASGWWVIEGFDNLWRIEAAGTAKKNCSDFKRLKY